MEQSKEKNSVVSNHEPETIKTNSLTIPKREATVIPEVPEQEIKLPIFLKQGESFWRIDAPDKYLNLDLRKYYTEIGYYEFDSAANAFKRHPENYEVITEQQFMDAFATALNQISNTAYGAVIPRVPDPDEFEQDDTDYSSRYDEDKNQSHEAWMAEQEDNFLNPDLP